MAKTRSELFAQIGTDLADNTTGDISPADLRGVCTQLADSMVYAAAGMKEVEVLRASSTAIQAPSAVGTALQLNFGAAQGAPTDPVMINAAGLVTFNQAGNYSIRIRTLNGRTGATGTSILLTRVLVSGVQTGALSSTKISATDSTVPVESRVVFNPTAGQTMAVEIMRDAAGSNFGGVYPQAATVTAWGTAPSTLIVVSRLEPVPSP